VTDTGARVRESVPVPLLLALRFLAELLLLTSYGVGGWALGDTVRNLASALALAIALPLLVALVWGRWVAPRASRRLPDPARLGVELLLFAGAMALLGGVVRTPTGVVGGLVTLGLFLVSMPARHADV